MVIRESAAMKSQEIRQQFIQFFETKNHKFVPSSPVIPQDDPTLLFSNAGMNQFKNIFLGLEKRDYTRAVNSQKCIRVSGKHNDLEEVGRDTYHHTFFEMLGNWSFGDYYKADAIKWAWELLTSRWKLPKDKLYVTVYKDDDEAESLWKKLTDVGPEQVLRFGEKENFWEMGDTGPCGPCSEIHIDLGPTRCDRQHVPGHQCRVNGDCGRFIELWNLVFIQYNREADGALTELSAKHVDTGMGFERIVSVLQQADSNYTTDLFTPIIQRIAELTNVPFRGSTDGVAHQVIADHVRSLTIAITDGGLPSNEGRGYVLRRILRRAARFGRTLGMHEPFIYQLVPTVVEIMGSAFAELKEKHQYVSLVIKAEEESFNNTLDRGIEIFERLADKLAQTNTPEIPGAEAFKLYDTYGFPLDLTELMAREKGLTVDVQGFNTEMALQRQRARDAGKWEYTLDKDWGGWEIISSGSHSEFVGYERLEIETGIREMKVVNDRTFLTLARTPFYAESGGQVGDVGEIIGADFRLKIENTIKMGDRIVHVSPEILPVEKAKTPVRAVVQTPVRLATARNHTATHLLQAALREILGVHVHQSGSFVTPERLRFDLTHFERITGDELAQIESRVNEKIRENFVVEKFCTDFNAAQKMGAMALFGEKYGDEVRVIKINDYSLELCGGTHLEQTGQIGYFRILAESSVAAGIRRIEAVTGQAAHEIVQEEHHLINSLRELLNVKSEEIPQRITDLLAERKLLEKQIRDARAATAQDQMHELVVQARELSGIQLVVARVESQDVDELKQMGEKLRAKLKSGVGVLGALMDDKLSFVCVVTDDLIKSRKLNAGQIVRAVAQIAGGSGGGKPHLALAGAKDLKQFDPAMNAVEGILRPLLANV
jgi:alanyl-tRNA synthetase